MNGQRANPPAGHGGVCAVLIDVLIDKGIISRAEVVDRLQRAQSAAGRRSGNGVATRELADIVACLRANAGADEPIAPQLDRSALIGETVLLVEGEAAAAGELGVALEHAGAEVLLARNAAEALPRIAQFDFSAAVVEWRPHTREHRTLVRWLREDGVRFIFRAAEPPEERIMACGLPILLKSAPPREIVAALARLTAAAQLGAASLAAVEPGTNDAESLS